MLKTSPPRVEYTWDLLLWDDLDQDHSKLLRSWCIKITDEPLVTYNEFIGFFDHDPSDLGWLILIYIIPKITHPYKRERILGTRLMSFATT